MAVLRSLIFYVFLVAVSLIFITAAIGARLRHGDSWPLIEWYLRTILGGLSRITGLKYDLNGREKLPDSPVLIASGQQSTWDNFASPLLFSNPAVVTKTELDHFPIVGWIIRNNGYIRAARNGDLATTKNAIEQAKRIIEGGRSVLIFPEGTRDTVPGDARIKPGSGVLYQVLKRPCVPVVVNSGDYWPYGHHVIRPGTITVEILEAIPAGLSRTEFERQLQAALNEDRAG